MTKQRTQSNDLVEQAIALLVQHLNNSSTSIGNPREASSPQTNTSLMSKITSGIDTESNPKIFMVIENGEKLGVFNKSKLQALKRPSHGLIFDATKNTLEVRHLNDKSFTTIDLTKRSGGHGKVKAKKTVSHAPGGSVLEILRLMMENPDRRFSRRVFVLHKNRGPSVKTFNKYIDRLKITLGDNNSTNPFIITDRGVEASTSKTRSAYFLNPDYLYRVIRYAKSR